VLICFLDFLPNQHLRIVVHNISLGIVYNISLDIIESHFKNGVWQPYIGIGIGLTFCKIKLFYINQENLLSVVFLLQFNYNTVDIGHKLKGKYNNKTPMLFL
jgi:hypothetical protein